MAHALTILSIKPIWACVRIAYHYVLLLGVFYAVLLITGYKFSINTSDSAKPGVYLLSKRDPAFKQGDFVAAKPNLSSALSLRHYIPSKRSVLKSIGAVPGEYLFTEQRTIFACHSSHLSAHCRKMGICLLKDHLGRSLSCQQWHGYQIPTGRYYLVSNRVPNSFDSRYFGLVRADAILFSAQLLLPLGVKQ